MALFGVGLLGSALRDALLRRQYRQERLSFDWSEPRRQGRQLDAIRDKVDEELAESAVSPVAWVWAAGRAGFLSTEADIAGELESFRRVLGLAESIAGARPEATSFHLLSSIGALFEGQRYIDLDSVPAVRRPYGDLKLRQEERLSSSAAPMARRIYRLTSAFGPPPEGGRRGLIATLVYNGLRQRVTRIVGRLSTLRDFVWTEDVARYLVRDILDRPTEPGGTTRTLGAGKPSSIHEILNLVESAIGRRPYVQFDFHLENSMDITLSPSILPSGWSASDLGMAVRRVHLVELRRTAEG